MMLSNSSAWKVRAANLSDLEPLRELIQRKSFVHRHLGWGSPLDCLGSEPFLILEDDSGILAALACPPDEDNITWLQLFAAAPGMSIRRCWQALWPQANSILQMTPFVANVNSLVIRNELDELLSRAGFKVIDQVVVLVWDPTEAIWPEFKGGHLIRDMNKHELEQVYRLDRLAFDQIWRNSRSQLEAAVQVAFSATVITIENQIRGYQISTVNPQGGHLARLVVDPTYQSQALGTKLLSDLLNKFLDQGIIDVSVNTQYQNQTSLDLYKKFGFRLLDERYPVRQFSYNDLS
jgi:ribosomal protein S18 acetylase RimI-like enzyme